LTLTNGTKDIYEDIDTLIRRVARKIEDGPVKVAVIKKLVEAQGELSGKSAVTTTDNKV